MACGGDRQSYSRGAQDEPGHPERLRRGRASPTPTGCTQSHPERPQWQEMPQEVDRDTHSRRGRAHGLHRGTGSAHATGGGAGCLRTLTRSQPRQTRHRPRQEAQGTEHPPTAHHANRGRTEATESQERSEEGGRYLLNKEDTQQSRRRSEKIFEKIEKGVDMWGHMCYIGHR